MFLHNIGDYTSSMSMRAIQGGRGKESESRWGEQSNGVSQGERTKGQAKGASQVVKMVR